MMWRWAMKLIFMTPGAAGDAGGGEDGVHRPRQLVHGRRDGVRFPEVHLDGRGDREVHWDAVHHDNLATEAGHGLGCRRPHPGGPPYDEHPPAVIPKRF